jgi:hypothetical protein
MVGLWMEQTHLAMERKSQATQSAADLPIPKPAGGPNNRAAANNFNRAAKGFTPALQAAG